MHTTQCMPAQKIVHALALFVHILDSLLIVETYLLICYDFSIKCSDFKQVYQQTKSYTLTGI